jgi:hypothetical protein
MRAQRGAVQQQPLARAGGDGLVDVLPLPALGLGPMRGQRLHLGLQPLPAGFHAVHGGGQGGQAFVVLVGAARHQLGRCRASPSSRLNSSGVWSNHSAQPSQGLPRHPGGRPCGGGTGVFVVGQQQGVGGHGEQNFSESVGRDGFQRSHMQPRSGLVLPGGPAMACGVRARGG